LTAVLVLGHADVEALLEPRELIDALARAFAEHAAGRSRVPPRATVPVTDDGVLLLMPAVAAADDGRFDDQLFPLPRRSQRARHHRLVVGVERVRCAARGVWRHRRCRSHGRDRLVLRHDDVDRRCLADLRHLTERQVFVESFR
jgi:hypothetical protein